METEATPDYVALIIMDYPIKTLLYELFVEPVLRLMRRMLSRKASIPARAASGFHSRPPVKPPNRQRLAAKKKGNARCVPTGKS